MHVAWALAPAVTALIAAAPPAGAPAVLAPAHAQAAAKQRKPVVCRSTQVRITVRGSVRCRTLPRRARTTTTPVASLRAAIRRDPGTVRSRSGKRIGSIWRAGGGRMQRVRTRLLRALPRVAALANGTARASATGDRRCADGPASSTTAEGFDVAVASDGTVSMSLGAGDGYRVAVLLGGLVECSALDLKDCPMPDGKLDGRDGRGQTLGVRVTKDGALVQSLRTTVRSTQTLTGTVADDAKLDRIKVQDAARQTISYQVPGISIVLTVALQGTAEVNMRSGAVIPGTARVVVSPASTAAAVDAGRAAGDYARTFLELVDVEKGNYARRESAWQTPGTCAKLAFDPASGSRKVRKSENGTLTAKIQARAGGLAAQARWTLSAQENGTFGPATPPAASQTITYAVTGEPRRKLKLKVRVTSTAGVDEQEWSQEIDDPARYFKVTGLEYTDQLALDGIPAVGTCTPSTSQTNSTTLVPSGEPWDGTLGSIDASGALSGGIVAHGSVLKTAAFSGCKLNDDGTAWVSCPLMSAGSQQTALTVDIAVPAAGAARATLQSVGLIIGDVPPVISPCVAFGTQVAHAQTAVIAPPAETFANAGPHTLAFDLPADVPVPAGGTLHSAAHYAFTIVRVNADGSPYTG